MQHESQAPDVAQAAPNTMPIMGKLNHWTPPMAPKSCCLAAGLWTGVEYKRGPCEKKTDMRSGKVDYAKPRFDSIDAAQCETSTLCLCTREKGTERDPNVERGNESANKPLKGRFKHRAPPKGFQRCLAIDKVFWVLK